MKFLMRYVPVAAAGLATGFAIGVLVFMWAYSSI